MNIYSKIEPEFICKVDSLEEKIILFDPAEIYNRIKIDPYKRTQSLDIGQMFPNPEDGTCSCGCGVKLTGRRYRWASEACQKLPVAIFMIIRGDLSYINRLMRNWLHYRCCECDCENYVFEKNLASGIQVDHIVGIQNGGGGSWLGNYRFICHKCHSVKTKEDNKVKKLNKLTKQPELF